MTSDARRPEHDAVPERPSEAAFAGPDAADFTWQLAGDGSTGADAIRVALGSDAAKLTFGPYSFDFAKRRSPDGDLQLTLTPDGGPDQIESRLLLGYRKHEQVIPAVPAHLPPGQRRLLHAEYLQVLGTALFDDAAHLVRLEMRLRSSVKGG